MQEAKDFREAFAMRGEDHATETPDPAIQKCMDMVMQKLRKDTSASSTPAQIEQVVNYFAKAIASEDTMSTDFRSMGAAVSWGFGRVAIGVRMGSAARLRVFNTVTGGLIAVPSALDWSYQFETKPLFLPGGMLVVDGPGIQDAGVRYGYRVLFLKPSDNGFRMLRSMRGVWTLGDGEEDSHLQIKGVLGTVSTIEEPKAFRTSNAERLFAKSTTYELDTFPFKVKTVTFDRAAIRAVDDWMAEAMKTPKTDLQREFAASYGKEPDDIVDYSEKLVNPDTFEVRLSLGKVYVFTVQSKASKYVIKSMKIEGQ